METPSRPPRPNLSISIPNTNTRDVPPPSPSMPRLVPVDNSPLTPMGCHYLNASPDSDSDSEAGDTPSPSPVSPASRSTPRMEDVQGVLFGDAPATDAVTSPFLASPPLHSPVVHTHSATTTPCPTSPVPHPTSPASEGATTLPSPAPPPLDQSSVPLGELNQEERIQRAIAAIRASGLAANSKKLSAPQAAKDFNVPRQTLTDRLNGKQTRQEAHAHQLQLPDGQEDILVEWAKEMGRRGVPITRQVLSDYASEIAGHPLGRKWIDGFRSRHPDLKLKRTSALEECRARALNPAVVADFYQKLKAVIEEYDVPEENIYNMDEKGIQLGVGQKVMAFVDRGQKTAYQVEHGSRELVTVIECVCADGTALPPSVIYQGKRRNLEWGRNNPCNASISHSENGWTDQELGAAWLERDFEPCTAVRNHSGRHRLLILDGHNSHTTWQFCKFAADHHSIVFCLPPHTTHALQPCDVAVFAPLASAWKSEVNRAAQLYIPITKYNLLEFYHRARVRSFKDTTIRAAFRKTGIWPFNSNALPVSAFAPSKNTTTEAAQPLSPRLPAILVPASETLSSASNTLTLPSSTSSLPSTSSGSVPPSIPYVLRGMPRPIENSAPHQAILNENSTLHALLEETRNQLLRNHAQMVLMQIENNRLRLQAFAKTSKPKKKETNAFARHLTGEESLKALQRADIEAMMKDVFKEAGAKFKQCRKIIAEFEKGQAEAVKSLEKNLERLRKEEEKQAKKAADQERKRVEKEAKDEQRRIAKAVKDAEKERKQAIAAAKRADAAAKRAKTAARRAETKRDGKKRRDVQYDEGSSDEYDEGVPLESIYSTPRAFRRLQTAQRHTPRMGIDDMIDSGELQEVTPSKALKKPRPKPRRLPPKNLVTISETMDDAHAHHHRNQHPHCRHLYPNPFLASL